VKKIVDYLKSAPHEQLNASMKLLIDRWSDPLKALEILKVLDCCVHGSLCSPFVVTLLQVLYDATCVAEGTTHQDVMCQATWRNDI